MSLRPHRQHVYWVLRPSFFNLTKKGFFLRIWTFCEANKLNEVRVESKCCRIGWTSYLQSNQSISHCESSLQTVLYFVRALFHVPPAELKIKIQPWIARDAPCIIYNGCFLNHFILRIRVNFKRTFPYPKK